MVTRNKFHGKQSSKIVQLRHQVAYLAKSVKQYIAAKEARVLSPIMHLIKEIAHTIPFVCRNHRKDYFTSQY